MCLWFVRLVVCLLLLAFHEAQAGEVPTFVAAFALISICRALKAFKVGGISTFAASVLLCLGQRTSCSGLVVFVPHSCFALALAWPGVSASCIFNLTVQCAGASSSGFG